MYCPKHPKYVGQTKPRSKNCADCEKVYRHPASERLRERVSSLRTRLRKGKDRRKRIGDAFNSASPDHWRWLLFNEHGLGLRPRAYTDKTRKPKVNDEAIERLFKRHPDLPLLQWKVELARARHRLSHVLAVEPDRDGRARFSYSLHRTSTGRISSGADDSEPEKPRTSDAGNAQNIKGAERVIYIPEAGHVFVQADWSQIEARVMAWMAGESRMLSAWRDGADVHALNSVALGNALILAGDLRFIGVNADNVRKYPSPINRGDSLRDAGKTLTHAWDYGMGDGETARQFGLTETTARQLRSAYFEAWPALAAWQEETLREALEVRTLANPFGRRIPVHGFVFNEETSAWELADTTPWLAFKPQSTVGDMLKFAMAEVERLLPDRLVTNTHDSLLLEVKDDVTTVTATIRTLKEVMERTWPEMGALPDFGHFSCPIDLATGYNWGKHHEHSEKCKQPCTKIENKRGLKEGA